MVRYKRALPYLLVALVLAVVVADRIAWASVAQWREDQATNMWLGYTRGPMEVPVGLLASIEVPNPNGMILLAMLLSGLPGLLWVSAFLGMLQAALLAWVVWLLGDRRLLWVTLGPLLSSIILRSASVEFVMHWILASVNLLFFTGVLLYMRRPTFWIMPLFVAMILLSASIYLAGAVNSVAFGAIAVLLVIAKWKDRPHRSWALPAAASALILLLSIGLTWLPYFQTAGTLGLRRASEYAGLEAGERVQAAFQAIVQFPWWSLSLYQQHGVDGALAPLQVDAKVLSPWSFSGHAWSVRLAWLQGLLCYVSVAAAAVTFAVRRRRNSEASLGPRSPAAVALALVLAFIVISYATAPLLGGPGWAGGARLDQTIQFIPFLLVLWFAVPPLLEMPNPVKRIVSGLTAVNAILFTLLSAVVGLAMVRENIFYRGKRLEADVPLIHKINAVQFIAEDWKAHSTSKYIAVDYDLGGDRWDWIPEFGRLYQEWYPAPYTLGRAFDYMLLREHGLINAQEGVQLRSFGTGRYLVTYAFEPRPVVEGHVLRQKRIGRLRVTVVEDR